MLRRTLFFVAGLSVLFFLACNSSNQDQSQTPGSQPPAAQTQPAPAQTQQPPSQAEAAAARPEQVPSPIPPAEPATRPKPAARRPTNVAPAPPAAQAPPAKPATETVPVTAEPVVPKQVSEAEPAAQPKPQPLVVPSGTRFEIRLTDPIGSADNKPGDTFKATLDQDLIVDGKTAVPKGSTVTGKLIDVKQSGRVEGVASMSVTLTAITVGDVSYPIQTNTLSFEAEKTTKQDATKVGIGAGLGAIIGAIAGGGKGAAIGAAVGGGAGTATVLATKGKEVKFQPEDRFSFVLKSDLGIRQQ